MGIDADEAAAVMHRAESLGVIAFDHGLRQRRRMPVSEFERMRCAWFLLEEGGEDGLAKGVSIESLRCAFDAFGRWCGPLDDLGFLAWLEAEHYCVADIWTSSRSDVERLYREFRGWGWIAER